MVRIYSQLDFLTQNNTDSAVDSITGLQAVYHGFESQISLCFEFIIVL